MQTISNPDRGCGNLVEGGCYLQAAFSRDGTLLPLTWALGTHLFGGENMFCELPPRDVITIDPELTFDSLELVNFQTGQALRMAGEFSQSERKQLARLGYIGLADHVGMNNYTAWSFAAELLAHGPSRRVPPKIAKVVAGMCPLRIFFSADLPLFETETHRDDFIRVNDIKLPDDTGYEPTWSYQEWGARLEQNDVYESMRAKSGAWHYACQVIKHLHDGEWMDVRKVEGLYAMSWITNVYYVCKEGQDEDDVPEDLMEAGVQPVRAAPKGQVVDR